MARQISNSVLGHLDLAHDFLQEVNVRDLFISHENLVGLQGVAYRSLACCPLFVIRFSKKNGVGGGPGTKQVVEDDAPRFH